MAQEASSFRESLSSLFTDKQREMSSFIINKIKSIRMDEFMATKMRNTQTIGTEGRFCIKTKPSLTQGTPRHSQVVEMGNR